MKLCHNAILYKEANIHYKKNGNKGQHFLWKISVIFNPSALFVYMSQKDFFQASTCLQTEDQRYPFQLKISTTDPLSFLVVKLFSSDNLIWFDNSYSSVSSGWVEVYTNCCIPLWNFKRFNCSSLVLSIWLKLIAFACAQSFLKAI